MNYYRRYSGDYLRDTARLSMLEHGAYGLMLDYYYAEEKPLPLDLDEIYTMVRAMTPADRKAVDKVLERYFTRIASGGGDDGYHNARADHEIEVSQKARVNGKGGGRPKTGIETGLLTGLETGSLTGSLTGEGGGSGHPPTTNHQPPASNRQPTSKDMARAKEKLGLKDLLDLGVEEQTAIDWLTVRRAKRAPLTRTALDDLIREAGKAGITLQHAVWVCARKSWQGFNAGWNWQDEGQPAHKTTAMDIALKGSADDGTAKGPDGRTLQGVHSRVPG